MCVCVCVSYVCMYVCMYVCIYMFITYNLKSTHFISLNFSLSTLTRCISLITFFFLTVFIIFYSSSQNINTDRNFQKIIGITGIGWYNLTFYLVHFIKVLIPI